MIFNDKMCTSGQLHRPQQLTNLVDPFSFSALHLLRTYNRLLAPTGKRLYFRYIKFHLKILLID